MISCAPDSFRNRKLGSSCCKEGRQSTAEPCWGERRHAAFAHRRQRFPPFGIQRCCGMTLRWAEVPNLASSTGESCRDWTGCRAPKRVTRDGVALPRPRPMRTPQPASSIRPPSALKPAARCAPDKRRAPRFPNRATGHLRPCRVDGIAVTNERKRNNKLQPLDARRHLHALNPEQRRAVEYGIGGAAVSSPALLVAAGAAPGKTKVLAHRVAHLILNGRDPQRLLLLTFTRRAALEMKRRTQLILAKARGDSTGGMSTPLSSLLPWSGTFHAMGSRLLRLHAGAIGLDASFTVLDRADSEDLLDLVRGELGLSRTASRFPRKGTCLAIYSYSINASCPLEETLAA